MPEFSRCGIRQAPYQTRLVGSLLGARVRYCSRPGPADGSGPGLAPADGSGRAALQGGQDKGAGAVAPSVPNTCRSLRQGLTRSVVRAAHNATMTGTVVPLKRITPSWPRTIHGRA